MNAENQRNTLRGRAVGRRQFLGVAGASALALKLSTLDFASSLFAAEAAPARKPRVQVVFLRPEDDRYWMSWPGASFDAQARQAEYTNTLAEAARKLGVDLEVRPLPLDSADDVAAFAEQTEKSPPDGLFLAVMHLKSSPRASYLVKNRPDVPTIVFCPLGSAFAEQLRPMRGVKGTLVAATQDPQWPATGLRMLKTNYELKQARLCIVAGNEAREERVPSVGTTLCRQPLDRWVREVAEVETTDEMRAIADFYAREARKIVEPKPQDVLAAAKNYVVARRIMAAEKCDGISVDCYPLLNERRVACGMCLAWSKLMDEGKVGACEADADAAVSQLLLASLLGRPGFMQDPAPNTLRNTLVGSHCTCPTKLDGFDQAPAPFVLRNQAESASGVALQVLWRPGQDVTVMKFLAPDGLLLATGRVLDNIDGPASTACRTALEIKIDGLADPCSVKDHHQLIVSGRCDEPLRAYAELAGLKVTPI